MCGLVRRRLLSAMMQQSILRRPRIIGQNSTSLQHVLNCHAGLFVRTAVTSTQPAKATGDISSVFPSLSDAACEPLPQRFAAQKRRLIQGHEERVLESWHQLLADLHREAEEIRAVGSSIIPEISFDDVKWNNIEKMTAFRDKLRKRGVAIIRGVVTEKEALGWKELVRRYIQANPSTKGRWFSSVLSLCLDSL